MRGRGLTIAPICIRDAKGGIKRPIQHRNSGSPAKNRHDHRAGLLEQGYWPECAPLMELSSSPIMRSGLTTAALPWAVTLHAFEDSATPGHSTARILVAALPNNKPRHKLQV